MKMIGGRKLFAAAVGALALTVMGQVPAAKAESPFHTGVWQVNTAEGPRGLVVSDWMIYDDGLPHRWIYRRAGGNDQNQFDFLFRNLGEPKYVDGSVRVYRTGEHTMKYTVFMRGQEPVENPSVRLSQPNYKNSCLSVEKDDHIFGLWQGTRRSTFKKLRLTKEALVIDGQARKVEYKQVRVGRIGIIRNGEPFGFFTQAGGDYAVLQLFKPGVTMAQMLDQQREILDFKSEEVAHYPKGDCDRQIAARMKLLGKM